MTPERWARVQELFEAAAPLPAADRSAHVRAAADDDEMATLVLSMLAASDEDTGEIERAVGDAIHTVTAAVAGAGRSAPRALSHRLGDWPGRHGHGLPGRARRRRVRAARGDQGRARPARPGPRAPVPRRAPDPGVAPSSEHRPPRRRRHHRRWLAVPGDGVRRGHRHRHLRAGARRSTSPSACGCSSWSARRWDTRTAT